MADIAHFIKEMPKAELHVHIEGAGQIYIEALKIAYDNLEKMSGTQNRLALV
jgi:adenosine deaminase